MNRSISREILAIALPAIIANITTPLLSMVDLGLVGHFGSGVYIAAITLGGTVFSSLYWIFSFLRMGTSGSVAQGAGAKDFNEVSGSLIRGLAMAFTAGVLIISLSGPLGPNLISFLSDGDSAEGFALEYFNVLVWGAPAMLTYYVAIGFLIGMKNSKATMWLALLMNLVNICASLMLVYVFNQGIKGVAGGTLIAQWTTTIAAIIYIAIIYKDILRWQKNAFTRLKLKRFFSINTDIFLRTLCLVGVTVWFTWSGARQGDDILAANALLMQFFMLFSYFIDGFAYAAEALVGHKYGEGDLRGMNKVVKRLMQIGLVLALFFSILYLFFGRFVLSVLTSEISVINDAMRYIYWAAIIPFVSFLAFVFDGVYIGLLKTRYMLIGMLAAVAAFVLSYVLLSPLIGNHGLWLAFVAYLATRSIVSLVIFKSKAKDF